MSESPAFLGINAIGGPLVSFFSTFLVAPDLFFGGFSESSMSDDISPRRRAIYLGIRLTVCQVIVGMSLKARPPILES